MHYKNPCFTYLVAYLFTCLLIVIYAVIQCYFYKRERKRERKRSAICSRERKLEPKMFRRTRSE